MFDTNWELIDGETAHDIEVLNYSNQVNVIEALVRFLIYHRGVAEGGCPTHPNAVALKEFHRTATLFLLNSPGEFRQEPVWVRDGEGKLIHDPPRHDEVPERLDAFFVQLSNSWASMSATEAGAFTLWFVNWVHPFKNGNGRTARAFCYACISLKLGFVLPGTSTVIDLVMQNRPEYQIALKQADLSFASTGTPDLTAMTAFMERLLIQQLSSIPV
jgi:Fic family protein